MSELSAADVLAMTNNREGDMWNNPFVYLIWIWAFGGMNGGWSANNAGFQGALTRADMCSEFNFNNLTRSVDNLKQGVCEGFATTNYNTMNGFNNVTNQIAENRFALQNEMCHTNRNIDSVKYENCGNTRDIIDAIRTEGALTRSTITDQYIQSLRDELDDKDRELLASNILSVNQSQTQNLINTLRPFPTPCYITCSPYASTYQNCCN